MKKIFALALAMLAAGSVPAFAQAVNAGDLLIYRVGTGTSALNSAAASVFIDEWTPTGSLVHSFATGITASGSATSEGMLNISSDNQFVTYTGYNAAVGTASVASTSTAAGAGQVLRSVGVLNTGSGAMTTTNFTNYSGNNIRGAVTNNGTNLWMVGANGVYFGSTQLSNANTRDVQIVGGQLYVSSSSGTNRLARVGSGTPTTSGQTVTNLPGMPTATGSPYSFFFADLNSSVAGVDTVYVADDTPGTIQKYTFNGSLWSLQGSATASGVRGLTGTVNGGVVQLYGTAAGSVFGLQDTGGYGGTLSGSATTVFTSSNLGGIANDYAFRGIVTAIPEPSTYALAAGLAGFGVVLLRRRRVTAAA